MPDAIPKPDRRLISEFPEDRVTVCPPGPARAMEYTPTGSFGEQIQRDIDLAKARAAHSRRHCVLTKSASALIGSTHAQRRQIRLLAAEGLPADEISARLNIAPHVVAGVISPDPVNRALWEEGQV